MAQAKAKKEYKKLFPGKAMPADRFADVELLVKQAADQPAAPLISIVVPLYNTPHDFLVELLDSVQNQTYRELGAVHGGCRTGRDVGALVQERARTDSRIRYRKLDSNEGIAGNTNQALPLPPVNISPCWTMMTFCTPVHCGMWRKPSPSRARTLCTPMK